MMNFRVAILTAVAASISSGKGIAETAATVVSSDLDLALVYLDSFERPGKSSDMTSQPGLYAFQGPGPITTANPDQERGLGLRHARVAFHLESIQSSKLTAVLRPDALSSSSRTEVRRELDTRAGEVYREQPDVRLLDAYQLILRPGTGMSLGVGVWEQLTQPALAYQQILQPGLDVLLPMKFSGLRLRWNRFQPGDPAHQESRLKGIVSDFFVIQGDRDRVETRVRQSKTDDVSPGAADPHYGAAATVQWVPSDIWQLMGTAGSLTSDMMTGGKVNDVFAELNGMVRFKGVLQGLTASMVFKQSRESFRDVPTPIEDRLNQSLSLLVATGIVPGTAALAGFSYGTGEWAVDPAASQENSEFAGYQVELGMRNHIGKDLWMQTMLAQERRTRKDVGGQETGAFVDNDDQRKEVRRIALQLNYQMSGLR